VVACRGGGNGASDDKPVLPTTTVDIRHAAELMQRFADRTGVDDPASHRRYLWTDAFAVCNFIALRHATGAARWGQLAAQLVARVHDVLAPHRDPAHPTAGGLRIGKQLPERPPDAPYDDQLEWDRDGQYFHYLIQWMHALDRLARDSERSELAIWACELARVAHRAFVYAVGNTKRMHWKMSVDLKRPLVPSMGQHDPLDGIVTYLGLEACSDLGPAIADFESMIDPHGLATSDPLGIGGLLVDAYRLQQWSERHGRARRELLDAAIGAAVTSLAMYRDERHDRPAEQRLAFRELGLAIGLAASAWLTDRELARHAALRDDITTFWLAPANRANATWREHEDINEVMLATALLPSGFLDRT